MIEYRITKFNPEFRKADGSYLDDDWTSVSDVGKPFKGKTLTLSDYLLVEDTYVESVRRLLFAANVTTLQVRNPEAKDAGTVLPEVKSELAGKPCFFQEGAELSKADIDWVVRLNLREVFWCRLEGTKQSFVHFGYDYYMYFGTNESGFILPSLPRLMYAEIFESPHKPEPA